MKLDFQKQHEIFLELSEHTTEVHTNGKFPLEIMDLQSKLIFSVHFYFKIVFSCENKRIIHSEDYYEFDGFIQFVQNIGFTEERDEADFQYIGENCDSLRSVFFFQN